MWTNPVDINGQMDEYIFYGPLSNGHTDHSNGHVRTCGPTLWTTVDQHSGHNTDKWTNLVDINGQTDQFSGHKWTIFEKDGNHFRLFLAINVELAAHSERETRRAEYVLMKMKMKGAK